MGRDLNPDHPTWQEYLDGLLQSAEPGKWTHMFYLRQPEHIPPPLPPLSFGCFSYAVWTDKRIRLHFQSNDAVGKSPLSRERMDMQLGELRAMVEHVKENVDNPTTVVGGSWLYNLGAYKRLFPPAFLATAYEGENEYPFIALWGQFLDRDGGIKPEMERHFLDCLARQRDFAGVEACFPFRVLRLESPIQDFYEFYQI
ncbi:MAG: hypothetical protein HY326_04210 [Chloroflexi bacterium]|nr:hypothetical protein [Chloroflexota bacterium]